MKKKSNFLKVFDKILPEVKMTERFIVYFSMALLFIISVTYFYWFGNGNFFYQENRSLFVFSDEYIQKFTSRPGGLLIYAGNFLTQFYFNSLYGSLIVSTLLILINIVFVKINKRLSAGRSSSLLFVLFPSCLLLLLQTRYDIYLQHSLGFLLVELWFLVSIVSEKLYFRLIFLGLFPLFYYLVGSFALIYLGMYIIFSVIYEIGIRRFYFIAFLTGIAFLTFIVFKEVVFLQPVDHLLGYPLFFNESSRLTTYLYLFGGFILLLPLLIKAAGLIKVNKKFEQFIPFATFLALFPVTVFILFKNYDPDFANLMQLEKLIYKQDWDSVIKHHERFPSTNVIGLYYYNLALSEKGQLCERMFFGQQNYGPMSLALPRDSEQAYRAVYFYYAIGLISEAHHLAYELMVQHGYRPENIKLLIKTELINGNYKIAERYINVLKKTLHYKMWAEKYEKMLLNPALINSDRELGEKVRLLPKRDFFILTDDAKNIERLLKENPDNKRAFEYKMARLLLEKDLLEVGSEVKKMKDIGYANIPRHLEEAVLALMNVTKEFPDLGGLSIRAETKRSFLQYRNTINSYSSNKSLLEKVMKKTEKNTFWYYLQFSVMRSDFFKRNPVDNSIY
jgi:hypothetical protein